MDEFLMKKWKKLVVAPLWTPLVSHAHLKAQRKMMTDISRMRQIWVIALCFQSSRPRFYVLHDVTVVLRCFIHQAVGAIIERLLVTSINESDYIRIWVSVHCASTVTPTLWQTGLSWRWIAFRLISFMRLSILALKRSWPWATVLPLFRSF